MSRLSASVGRDRQPAVGDADQPRRALNPVVVEGDVAEHAGRCAGPRRARGRPAAAGRCAARPSSGRRRRPLPRPATRRARRRARCRRPTSSQRSSRPAGAFASMAAASPNRTGTTMPSSTALATASSATPSSAHTTAEARRRPAERHRAERGEVARPSVPAGASDGGELIAGGGGRRGASLRGRSSATSGSGTAPADRPRVPRISRASLGGRRPQPQLARDPHRALDELGVVARHLGRGCSGRCPPARRGCSGPWPAPSSSAAAARGRSR